MEKLAIILDSSCGKNQKEVEKMGYYFISLRTIIDDEVFYDDGAYSKIAMMAKIKNSNNVKTSLPNLAQMSALFERLIPQYEHIIYLPIGAFLSGTYSAARTLAKSYPKDKIVVIDNNLINSAYFEISEILLKMAKANKSMAEMIAKVEKFNHLTQVYIIPNNLDAFRKGGRIGATSQFILSKLKIVPILKYTTEVKAKSVRRTFKKAFEVAINRLVTWIKENGYKNEDYKFILIHQNDPATFPIAHAKLTNHQINFKSELTSPIVMVHTGLGAVSLTAYPHQKATII